MTRLTRTITLAAALLGLLGVALGAFGAHGLKAILEAHGSIDTWKTAVLYQLVHAVALLALANSRDSQAGPAAKVALLWIVGVVLFSGSLYWLSLGGPRLLGPITPAGGVAFLVGWALLAWDAWKRPVT
jgi:uncharacterized membrane protein YgdD (TMEM256/DUF423 family)